MERMEKNADDYLWGSNKKEAQAFEMEVNTIYQNARSRCRATRQGVPSQFRALVLTLPESKQLTLKAICALMARVVEHTDVNKMEIRRLGMCIRPAIAAALSQMTDHFDVVFK